MISVQIIGCIEQIKQELKDENIAVSYLEDEVLALNTVEKTKPSVVLLDYALRKEETADYIKLLLKISKESKIIVIANKLNDDEVLNCLIAGAKGYQNSTELNDYVLKMITVINAGEAWVSRRMVAKLLTVLVQKQLDR